jgi:predicted enzyme related to lactoylglutathione lyase
MSFGELPRLQSVRPARGATGPALARPTLGAILLGSAEPDRLRGWYAAAFETEPDADGFLQLGGVAMLIDRRLDVATRNPDPGRFTLHICVDGIRCTVARLDRLGGSCGPTVEDRGGQRSAALVDPDGNHVRLIEATGADDRWRGR